MHLPGKAALLGALALLVAIGVVIRWWQRRRASALEQVAYALLVGGAVGNLLDRFLRGYVVDFIHVWRWSVFNVADIAVVAGALLLAALSQRSATTAGAVR